MKQRSNFPLPKQVVCNFDKALMGTIVKAFCKCKSLHHYLSQSFKCLNEKLKNLSSSFLRLDISYYIHMVSRWKEIKTLYPQVCLFYISIMAYLTKVSDFIELQEIANCYSFNKQ